MLRQIQDAKVIRKVWRDLEKQMLQGSRRENRNLGSRIASHPDRLIIREDLGIWTNPGGELSGRRWCIFGVLPLPESGNLAMVVQINPAIDPSSKGTGGCLAQDGEGDLWICHTGRVGGGRPGINRSQFLKWTSRSLTRIQREGIKPIDVFPIARAGDPEMLTDIAEYVWEVHAFKNGEPRSGATHSRRQPFLECEESGVGERTAASYQIRREHGMVCNRLIELLQGGGYEVGKDQFRDAFVGSAANPDVEFEVKPTSLWQDLYTAVGQLKLHSTSAPARKQVLVVPAGISREKQKAISAAGIDLIKYSRSGSSIRFAGLANHMPKSKESIPARGMNSSSRRKDRP